jgi:hypothetical protein
MCVVTSLGPPGHRPGETTMRKFKNQIAALGIAPGLIRVSMLFDRRL